MMDYLNRAISTHKTLDVNIVDKVTFSNNYAAIEVKNRGVTDDIYFRLGAIANPVVGADDTYFVQAGESVIIGNDWANDEVRLISAGAVAYSVTGIGRVSS